MQDSKKAGETKTIRLPERFALALLFAIVGFLTGVLGLWALATFPGVSFSGYYLLTGICLSIICAFFGFLSPENATNTITKLWKLLSRIHQVALDAAVYLKR